MPLDGISAPTLARELSGKLHGARLDRIQQPERLDVFLTLYGPRGRQRLLLSANPALPRMHLTAGDCPSGGEPPMFCMFLRKHLLGARLLDVDTIGWDRVFRLRFQNIDEIGDLQTKTLVFEWLGRSSNLLLLNRDGRILDALIHMDGTRGSGRELMPARLYAPPSSGGGLDPDQALARITCGDAWLDPINAGLPAAKALSSSLSGFSPAAVAHLLIRSGLDGGLPLPESSEQRSPLDSVLKTVLTDILAGDKAFLLYTPSSTAPSDFHILPLATFARAEPADSLSDAMDRVYTSKVESNRWQQRKQSVQRRVSALLDRAERRLEAHRDDLRDGQRKDEYRRCGELLLGSGDTGTAGRSRISVTDYADPLTPEVSVPLDPVLSVSQNAQRYFRLYAKARTRLEMSERFVARDEARLEWLQSLLIAADSAETDDDLDALRSELAQRTDLTDDDASGTAARASGKGVPRPTEPASSGGPGKPASRGRRQASAKSRERSPERVGRDAGGKPRSRNSAPGHVRQTGPAARRGGRDERPLPVRRFVSSDGLTILVGRNNLQNDQLTLRTAQADDLWLHVQKMPGTHVIVRTERRPVPDRTLEEAAAIAAWYSRGTAAVRGQSGSLKIPVDYCPVSHVRKPAGAPPGKVIYEGYRTILVQPRDPQALAQTVDPDEGVFSSEGRQPQ